MAKKGDGLFDLIHTLSKSEKRYFKLFANLQKGKEKKYLKVFDAIASMEEYDEKKLREKLKGETFLNELHVIKNYLFEMILDSLQKQENDRSAPAQTLNLLQQQLILYRRGLNQLSYKKLKKAKQLATKQSLVAFVPLILAYEWRMAFTKPLRAAENSQIDVTQELLKRTEELHFRTRLYDLWLKVSAHSITQDRSPNFAEECKNTENTIKSLAAELETAGYTVDYYPLILNKIQFDFALARNDLSAALHYSEQELKFFETHLENILAIDYYFALHDYFSVLRFLHFAPDRSFLHEAKIKEYLERFHALPDVNANLVAARESMKREILISWYVFMGRYKDALPIIQEEFSALEHEMNTSMESMTVAMHFYAAHIYFALGDATKVLFHLNQVLTNKQQSKYNTLSLSCWIISMITHYELGNQATLKKLITDYTRRLEKHNILLPFDTFITTLLTKASRKMSEHERKELFKKAHREAEDQLKNLQDGFIFELFPLKYWLEAKSKGKSLQEILQIKSTID